LILFYKHFIWNDSTSRLLDLAPNAADNTAANLLSCITFRVFFIHVLHDVYVLYFTGQATTTTADTSTNVTVLTTKPGFMPMVVYHITHFVISHTLTLTSYTMCFNDNAY